MRPEARQELRERGLIARPALTWGDVLKLALAIALGLWIFAATAYLVVTYELHRAFGRPAYNEVDRGRPTAASAARASSPAWSP